MLDRYTVETQDERYTDFIDLDACVRNIVRQIGLIQQMDEDCFFFASMRKNTVLWNRQNVNNVKIVFVTQK